MRSGLVGRVHLQDFVEDLPVEHLFHFTQSVGHFQSVEHAMIDGDAQPHRAEVVKGSIVNHRRPRDPCGEIGDAQAGQHAHAERTKLAGAVPCRPLGAQSQQ